MLSLELFIDIILPIALWPWGWLSLYQKWAPGVFPGGKCSRCVRLTTLPPSWAVVMKSGNLNLLEPPGPLQACNGTALPLLFYHLACGGGDCFPHVLWQISPPNAQHPLLGHGLFLPRGFTIILRHITLGMTPLDEWSARRKVIYLTTQNTHKRQTSMFPAGFELVIPTSEQTQIHTLDSAVTEICIWPTTMIVCRRPCCAVALRRTAWLEYDMGMAWQVWIRRGNTV